MKKYGVPSKDTSCDGKAKFRSEKYARGRMRQSWQDFEEGMVPYLCAYCYAWHIGHTDEIRGRRTKKK